MRGVRAGVAVLGMVGRLQWPVAPCMNPKSARKIILVKEYTLISSFSCAVVSCEVA